MKKNYVNLILSVILCLLSACSDDQPKDIRSALQFMNEVQTVNISSDGNPVGDSELLFESMAAWTGEVTADWLSITPASGGSGIHRVQVHAVRNESEDIRNGKIILRCGEASYSIDVSQAAKDALVIAQKQYDAKPEGESIRVEAASTGRIEVIVDATWIHQTTARTLTEQTFMFKIDQNSGTDDRTATITFKSGAISQEMTVSQPSMTNILNKERNALIAFYNATNGDGWKDASGVYPVTNENWLSDKPVGDWQHVTVDDRGYVTGLVFAAENLSGYLPAELGDLKHLKTLKILSNPEIGGKIPPELGQCAELEILNIEGSKINGEIPRELGNCRKLKTLLLSCNRLTGEIPAELCNLTDLFALAAYGNELTGMIPSELGNLTKLEFIRLSENQLTGEIPSSLSRCSRITHADFSGNFLSGSFPESIEKPWRYDVSNNDFSGNLPANLISDNDLFAANWGKFLYGNKFDTDGVKIPGIYFDVTDVDGKNIKSTDVYGNNKLTILYQWASFCNISNGMTPVISSIYSLYKDAGLAVVGITYEDVGYVKSLALPFPNVVLNSKNYLGKPDIDVMSEHNIYRPDLISNSTAGDVCDYPVFVYPTVTVIDNSGYIVFSDMIDDPYSLETFVAEYLGVQSRQVKIGQTAVKHRRMIRK